MRNPIMIGKRIYLRPVTREDAASISRYDALETDTMMHRWRIPTTNILWENYFDSLHKTQPPESIFLAVCLKEDDTFIGSMELHAIDYVNRTAETGAWLLAPEFRNKGYGTEAKHLLLEYAFDRLHLHVLWSWVWEPNTRSASALLKQGYRPAGKLLRQDVKNGVVYGAFMFDVKREEWLAARETWLESQKAFEAAS
jgi:ribosomal-protein-alanine N-acetyltransferase